MGINTIFRLFILFFIFGCAYGAETTATSPTWPENITPNDLYKNIMILTQYTDQMLAEKKITEIERMPAIDKHITPMVVYQIAIANIELLHQYELSTGLRPIPIVTSSPIEYYPADINFLVRLMIERIRNIAEHEKLKLTPPKNIDQITGKHLYDAYKGLLHFYIQLSALDGTPTITANQVYEQVDRAKEEMKDIIFYYTSQVKSTKDKRALAATTYGGNPYRGSRLKLAPKDVEPAQSLKQMLKVRRLMQPFLKHYNITPIPITPMPDKTIRPFDVFIQTQLIIAEIGEWKRALNIVDTSPVTASAADKTPKDVMQDALYIVYMLEKLTQTDVLK